MAKKKDPTLSPSGKQTQKKKALLMTIQILQLTMTRRRQRSEDLSLHSFLLSVNFLFCTLSFWVATHHRTLSTLVRLIPTCVQWNLCGNYVIIIWDYPLLSPQVFPCWCLLILPLLAKVTFAQLLVYG